MLTAQQAMRPFMVALASGLRVSISNPPALNTA